MTREGARFSSSTATAPFARAPPACSNGSVRKRRSSPGSSPTLTSWGSPRRRRAKLCAGSTPTARSAAATRRSLRRSARPAGPGASLAERSCCQWSRPWPRRPTGSSPATGTGCLAARPPARSDKTGAEAASRGQRVLERAPDAVEEVAVEGDEPGLADPAVLGVDSVDADGLPGDPLAVQGGAAGDELGDGVVHLQQLSRLHLHRCAGELAPAFEVGDHLRCAAVVAGDWVAPRDVPDDVLGQQLDHAVDRAAGVHLVLAAVQLGDQLGGGKRHQALIGTIPGWAATRSSHSRTAGRGSRSKPPSGATWV